MKPMTFMHAKTPQPELDEAREPALVRDEGAWRVFPLEGTLELHYRDVAGNPSRRRILAHELKVGPGKTLLGGIDQTTDGYRGFRADRIDYVIDVETGQNVDRNILDWLIKRAQRQLKDRQKALRQAAEAA